MLTIRELAEAPATLPLVPDVAEILGIGATTAYELAAKGRLPAPIRAFKLGTSWRVQTGHLMRFLGLPVAVRSAAPSNTAEALEKIIDGALVIVSVRQLREVLGAGTDGNESPSDAGSSA
jgi:hypothetical protein